MKNFESNATRRTLAILLLLEVLSVLIPFFILGSVFEFPDILRQPAAKAFALFHQNQAVIVPTYYVFLVSALLYFPLGVFLKNQWLQETKSAVWLDLMYVSAIATGIFQAIGFSRWVIAMPFLSAQYQQGAHLETITVLYEWINRFVGTTVGEHLGFLAMGFWMIALSVAIPNKPWFKTAGTIIGLLLMLSTLEHFGGPTAPIFALVNILANVCWSVWMLVLAVQLFKKH
jgi:hypothetical protein